MKIYRVFFCQVIGNCDEKIFMCRKSVYHNIIDYKTINSYNYEKILMRGNQQWQRVWWSLPCKME